MRSNFVLVGVSLFAWAIFAASLIAQTQGPTPDENPESNTGALKEQIRTGGSYDAHSGNATRIVEDLHLPGALGKYGLDLTRYWNSLHPDYDNTFAEWPGDFGSSGWTHSWRWGVTTGADTWAVDEAGNTTIQYWESSITIAFPDGHSVKYKILRVNRGYTGEPLECRGRDANPPFLAQCGERDWPEPGAGVHDHLNDMAEDGSEFWLYLADGGSVHFTGGYGNYLATEVFDPNGFRTDLHYRDDGRLDKVTQEDGGRWLNIAWGNPEGFPEPAIVQVSSGGFAGVQTVTYNYNRYPVRWTGPYLVLTSVSYPEGVAAVYSYGSAFIGDDPNTGPQSVDPLLKAADDPRYHGPMTRIRYDYYGGFCPPPEHAPDPPPAGYFDRFYPQPFAIAAEKSGDTGIPVSQFANFCASSARTETNGFGATRGFSFGGSAGQQGGMGYHCLGFQLAKVTDFTVGWSANLPFEFQNFFNGHPRQVWDGRGIQSDLIMTGGDDSGLPGEVHHTGSDGTVHYYDRIHPGNSDPRDTSRIHNPYPHWLFSQTDERYLTTTYTRDSRRRIHRIDYPGGSAEIFEYNEFNQVTSHTLPSSAVVTYEYDPTTHRLLSEYNSVDGWDARKQYTYDPLERVATVSDGRSRSSGRDFSTRMTYNSRHQVLTVEYAGMTNSNINDNPHISYSYDAYGNCTSITDELGHTSLYTYDPYRRCTSYTEPLNSPDAWENNMPSRRWEWGYDRVIVNPDGTSNYFPESDRHTKNEWRWQLGPAYNYLGDRPAIDRGHDAQNRIAWERTGWILTASNQWVWSGQGETVYYTYDENGQKKTYTDAHGRLTTYDYDLRNRLWKTNETVNTVQRTTETLYDEVGNKTRVNFPVEAAGQRSQQWLDYDAFGQPGRFIDERGNTTNILYWWGPMKKLGMVTTYREKDAGGTEEQVTVFSYDYMGRPTNTWFPDGGYAYGSHEDFTYEFGQLKTWTNRKGQTKYFHYDARGREDSNSWDNTSGACDPTTDNGAAGCIARQWDPANRLVSIQNKFATINYTYNDAAQVLSESESIAGATGTAVTGYRYYGNGTVWNLIYPNGMRVAHAYSAQLRLQTVWDHGPNNWQLTVNYTYTDDGKIDHGDYGNGVSSNYGYDQRGFLNSVFHHRGWPYQTLSSRTYWRDERDRITAYQKSADNSVNPMENGRGNHYQYDAEGQLTDAWYEAVDPAGAYSDCQRQDHFAYDALGNRFGWDYVQNKGWMHFLRQDNGLNQYLSWENNYPGNDPQHWGTTTNYDNNINGWRDSQGHANGVLMQDGNITAGYNALNQPMLATSLPLAPNWMFFGYDPLGRCVKRWTGGLTPEGNVPPPQSNRATYYYYDGWNLIQEGSSASDAQRQYEHGARVDEVLAEITPPNNWIRYFHYDASGNCTLQTDGGGNIAEQYEYDAFGYPYFYDGSGVPLQFYDNGWKCWRGYSPWGNRFLFAGREWLSDLRLFDFRARMYQPELGRFLQPDPKHFAAGDYNLYRYCHNDPVNHSDPTGTYGRGAGFSDDQWNKFRAAQDAGVRAIEKALENMTPKAFEETFGPGSATPENMQRITQTLRGIQAALADNGKGGYFANATTAAELQSLGKSPRVGGFTYPSDNKSIYVNVDHKGFGGPLTPNIAVHEGGHNMGLVDFQLQRIGAYQHGDYWEQQLFHWLPSHNSAAALTNSDTVTSLVFP